MVDCLSTLGRLSDEDFQLLIKTVWSLPRCNFLNLISGVPLFICFLGTCLPVICLCGRTLLSFWQLTAASNLFFLFHHLSRVCLFCLFFLSPPFSPETSLHSFCFSFCFCSPFISFFPFFYSSLLLFTLKVLGLRLYSELLCREASHGRYSIWAQ